MCRRWYHSSCLSAYDIDEDAPNATRGLRLLANDPDNETCVYPALSYFSDTPSKDMDDIDLSDQVSHPSVCDPGNALYKM